MDELRWYIDYLQKNNYQFTLAVEVADTELELQLMIIYVIYWFFFLIVNQWLLSSSLSPSILKVCLTNLLETSQRFIVTHSQHVSKQLCVKKKTHKGQIYVIEIINNVN